MDKNELIRLVRKYLKGKATLEEKDFVESWYRDIDSSRSIDPVQSDPEIERLEQEIFRNINSRIGETAVRSLPAGGFRTRPLYRNIAVAASVLLLITAGWLIYRHATSGKPDYTTIYSKPGKVSKVTLSDGSLVWVNADSRLRFPTAFGRSGTREIFLEGEAYFEVAKDGNHPFLVHTQSLTTHVLGTRFNIKAFPGHTDIEVTLLEGRVMLSAPSAGTDSMKTDTLYLAPNQKAFFTGSRLNIENPVAKTGGSTADRPGMGNSRLPAIASTSLKREWTPFADESASWRDGRLIFRNTPLAAVIESLARKYNIRIQSDSSLFDSPVSANIENDLNAEEALLEVTRRLKRINMGSQGRAGDKVQIRKDGSVYYIE